LIILCTADNHIGFKQYGLKQREKDIEDSFFRILETGVKINAAAITVSGDLLHSVRPTSSTVGFLKKCQEYLYDNNLPCLVSEGNHDKSKPHWITNISRKDRSKGFVFLDNEKYDLDGFNIFGNSFTTRDNFDKGSYVPRETDLLLMHQQFSEFANFPNEKIFDCNDFQNLKKPTTVVVGDIHITNDFVCEDGHRVYSPGSTELMSESESEKKYVCVYDTDKGTISHQDIVTRNVIRLEVREDNDIEPAISAINKSEQGSMVFIKFNTSVENIISRIRSATRDSEPIIRPKPIMEFNGKEVDFSDEIESDLTLNDVLQEMIDDKNPIYEIASQLTNPEADVVSMIDEFVEKRIKEI